MCIASDFGFVLFHIWTTVYFYLFILVWDRAAGMFNAVEYIAEGDQVVA